MSATAEKAVHFRGDVNQARSVLGTDMAKAGSKSRRTRSAPSALPAFQPTEREYPTRPTKDAARSASSVTRFGPRTSPRKCRFRKKNGKSCSADAQIGKDLCVFHDPAKAADGRRARRAGGINRSQNTTVLPPETPDIPLRTIHDVSTLLAESINQVRRGQLDARVKIPWGSWLAFS